MRLKKPFVTIPAAIAIFALAALLLLWLSAYTPFGRRAAAGWIEDATGVPASLERLRIGFLPRPSLTLGGLALGQPAGFGPGELLAVGRLRIALPWGSLLGGTAVDSIRISDVTARPAFAADGSDNWTPLFERLAELGGEGEADWSIGEVALERGAVEFEDAASGAQWRLTAVSLAAQDLAPRSAFPVELRLAGVQDPNTFHLLIDGRVTLDPDAGRYGIEALGWKGWAGGEPLPLAGVEFAGGARSVTWDAATATASLRGGSFNVAGMPGEFAGELTLAGESARMNLRVRTESFAPRKTAVAFGRPLPRTTDPGAFGAVQASFTCVLEDGVLRLDPIEAQLDDTRITGSAVPQQRRFRLVADRIDLDRYLAPGTDARKEKKETLESAVAGLRELDVDAEIRIGEARVAGARLRDALVRIEREAETR